MATLQQPIQNWFSYDFNTSYCGRNRLFNDDLTIVSKYPDEDDRKKQLVKHVNSTIKRSTSLTIERNVEKLPQEQQQQMEPRRRKKSVRFADTEGLTLENIRVIHNQTAESQAIQKQEVNSAKNRLDEVRNYFRQRLITQIAPRWSNQIYSPQLANRSALVPEFVQPVTLIDFIERVRNQMVCLQSCLVTNEDYYIKVTLLIRVLNVCYEKNVSIRYTLDNWLTYTDLIASYVKDSSDEWSDEFKAIFQINTNIMKPGQKVFFAISFKSNGTQYWDNNSNNNYSLVYRV